MKDKKKNYGAKCGNCRFRIGSKCKKMAVNVNVGDWCFAHRMKK